MPPCSGLIRGKELSSLYFILKCNVNLGRMYQLPLTYLELTIFIGIMQGVLPNYIYLFTTHTTDLHHFLYFSFNLEDSEVDLFKPLFTLIPYELVFPFTSGMFYYTFLYG